MDCACGHSYRSGNPIWMIHSTNDQGHFGAPIHKAMMAVHEYTHTAQMANGDFPAWSVEGGAVWMECFFAKKLGLGNSLSSCLKGRATAAIRLYVNNPGVRWLEQYGDDWCCGSPEVCRPDELRDNNFQFIYYDLGAVVTMFAMDRARACTGRTMLDYWTTEDGLRRRMIK